MKTTIKTPFPILAVLWLAPWAMLHAADASQARRPNLVYILADDLGYGDVQWLNPQRDRA